MAHQDEFVVETRGRGTQDITPEVARIVRATGVRCGLAHVFVLHTSASLLLTENADPATKAPTTWRRMRAAPSPVAR